MGKSVFLGFCLALQAGSVLAQLPLGGIYSTAEDFEHDKFSFSYSCDSGKVKIRFNEFTDKPILIISRDKNYPFSKSEIFGLRDCAQRIFRIYKNEAYQLINQEAIWLYRQERLRNKSTEREQFHFFTSSVGGPLLPLTVAALKTAFSSNVAFLDLVNKYIHEDEDLVKFDPLQKKFKVIQLFNQSYR